MNQFCSLLLYAVFIFFSIYIAHQLYSYIQDKYVPKVTKMKYYNQGAKYDDIIKEVQDEMNFLENDKIEMENDLSNFIEENIKQYK
jgi:hypothetical protein